MATETTANATACRCGEPPAAVVAEEDILEWLQQHDGSRGGLVALLQAIQARYGYLPEAVLREVSQRTGCSLVDLYGVATFYRSFSLQPRGEHLVCACMGTACHVRGAARILEQFEEQLGIAAGETTPDGQFTLETVNCLGACALGPAVVIDGRYFSKVKKSGVRQLLDDAQAGFGCGEGNGRIGLAITVTCSRCNRSLMDSEHPLDGHPSIRVSVLSDRQHGLLRISSWYGDGRVSRECDLSGDRVARFFCPHCHGELAAGSKCAACQAPLVALVVAGGAMLRICSRIGCEKYLLDLT
jgi:NADH-quinone oxidoreductase subunit E